MLLPRTGIFMWGKKHPKEQQTTIWIFRKGQKHVLKSVNTTGGGES